MKNIVNLKGASLLSNEEQKNINGGGKGIPLLNGCAVSKKCFTASDCLSFASNCVVECFSSPNGGGGICVGY
ncbi:hypothetical protein [Tenacibaculum agarivorans]|uniref:hypothetical protein n=1 Tax=Tenacibaculum agarivorans TaxID=1908389 RepID=UPI00094B824B|nr:hypothetical protein [Tenacibaculum agarivorans]